MPVDGTATDAGGRLRALVVDDEPPLVQVVTGYLAREGFEVASAGDGLAAVEAARGFAPDVVVLDLMLPGIDGMEVCRRLRGFSDAYVIMLTARDEEVDKLVGLAVGADDYLTKPFSPRELVARVRAMLRRPRPHAGTPHAGTPHQGGAAGQGDEVRRFGGLEIDPAAREARVDGAAVALTRTEFDLLDALSARPRVVFERRQLLRLVWGAEFVGDEHVVDVHVGNLRRKLGDDAGRSRYVRTVRGVGYRMGTG